MITFPNTVELLLLILSVVQSGCYARTEGVTALDILSG
jgi:hypothetical protein